MLMKRQKHEDHRGWVIEAWRASEGFGCQQVTLVGCAPGIWKGLHFHPRKASVWMCAGGRLLARVGDSVVPLAAGDGVLLAIPPGVPHDVMGLAKRNVLVELDNEEFVEGDKVRL